MSNGRAAGFYVPSKQAVNGIGYEVQSFDAARGWTRFSEVFTTIGQAHDALARQLKESETLGVAFRAYESIAPFIKDKTPMQQWLGLFALSARAV